MTFTAIDFETAHAGFPCEVGLTRVENGVITRSASWLVKPACFPYMNPFNERVHGISSADVATAPTFEELWGELRPWLEDELVVAHNAPFDMHVLRTSLAHYDLAVPWIDYFCSVRLSRKVWKNLPSHSLGKLCEYHNISFEHHRAGDDAKACAIITLKALEETGNTTVLDGLNKLGVKVKRLSTEFGK
ncbi:DNA polymerase III subunit epsilon [Paludibacter sp. 221]|uniref:3'-5' exonuclease n=1 Tax=Paludibacter sp. 221 TaxID=2302939 RepID=UPI0013D3ABB3|nr:3'-5' exonuclease [Paludibacter sp. 221]NDV47474.1 DNA polymerase III subunit epsilon [Paludibacter sp. 221]